MEARVGDGRTVILHVDLDCFYAAVEHVRLGIPTDKPLAVQQWEGLIAVNYPARAAGIVRHDRVKEALKKCPELQLVHVETVGNEEPDAAPSRSSSKVSLERYRQASLQVFSIFRRFSSICERASIDEAYMDVTNEVDEMLKQNIDLRHELQRLSHSADNVKPVMVVENGPCNLDDPFEARLVAGALIGNNIRAATRQELGYTCSVGIAPNKLLAKIASARNKPDRETIVLPRAVSSMMENLPLKKIKLLGGKVGEELQTRWSFTTAGEAQAIPLQALISCFGERIGSYAWRAVRGAQNDKVQVKEMPKSMLAAKSFSATSDPAEIRRWFGILSEELSVRLLRDLRLNQRQPKVLHLYYRSGYRDATDHSKSSSMPHAVLQLLSSVKCPLPDQQTCEELATLEDDTQERTSSDWPPQETTKALAKVIQEAAFHLFQQLDHKLPYTRLAISASGFQNLHVRGVQSIERFFSATTNTANTTSTANFQVNCQVSKPQNIKKFFGSSMEEKPARAQIESTEDAKGTETTVRPQGISKFLVSLTSVERTEAEPVTATATESETRDTNGTEKEGCRSTELQGARTENEAGNIKDEVDINHVDIAEQHRILRRIEQSSSKQPTRKRNQAEGGARCISSFFKKVNRS